MKIIFNALKTNDGKISISLDGGITYTEYNVSDVKDTGFQLDDSQDLSLIRLKSTTKVIDSLEVFKSVVAENQPFFVMNYSNGIWPDCVEEIIFPDGIKRLSTGYINIYDAYNNSYNSQYIGLRLFPNLKKVIIPDSVDYIDDGVFKNCNKLEDIICKPELIRLGLFNNINLLKKFNLLSTDNPITESIIETSVSGCNNYEIIESGQYTVRLNDTGEDGDVYFYIYVNGELKGTHDDGDVEFTYTLQASDILTIKIVPYSDRDAYNDFTAIPDQSVQGQISIIMPE